MKKLTIAVTGVLFFQYSLWAQCNLPGGSNWQTTNLVNTGSLSYPTNFSMLPDGRTFFSEMWSGNIKLYTPGQGITTLGQINVYTDNGNPGVENGLLGVVVDPNFDQTGWIYALYSRTTGGSNYSAGDGNISPHEHVLSRYTVSNNNLTSRKDIISFTRLTARHAAGGLDLDPTTGDLYITTGDDSYPSNIEAFYGPRKENTTYMNDLRSAANTNDLRGKTLRIRPRPFPDNQTPAMGVGTTYDIPAGNLRDAYSSFWTAENENPNLVRPEVYTMGHRNPYHIKYDPATGLALIGEVGPDGRNDDGARGPRGREEFNLVEGAGNFGYPFAIGTAPYTAYSGEAYSQGTTFDLNNLENLSNANTGVTSLPPAVPAFGWYGNGSAPGVMSGFGTGGQTAMAGPLYHYDPNLNSNGKLPAYFNGKFLVADWSMGNIFALELNPNHTLASVTVVRTGLPKIIDLAIGADGALYYLRYSTGNNGYHGGANAGVLTRLDYTGNQYAANTCSHYVPATTSPTAERIGVPKALPGILLSNLFSSTVTVPEGAIEAELYALNGEKLQAFDVENISALALPENIQGNGPVYLKFKY